LATQTGAKQTHQKPPRRGEVRRESPATKGVLPLSGWRDWSEATLSSVFAFSCSRWVVVRTITQRWIRSRLEQIRTYLDPRNWVKGSLGCELRRYNGAEGRSPSAWRQEERPEWAESAAVPAGVHESAECRPGVAERLAGGILKEFLLDNFIPSVADCFSRSMTVGRGRSPCSDAVKHPTKYGY
jgi:hypothetical protein